MVNFPFISILFMLSCLAHILASHGDGFGNIELWGGGSEVLEEEYEFDLPLEFNTELGMWNSQEAQRIPVNVDSFGAVGDGVADDTKAFQDAWNMACTLKNAVFLVPNGRHYLVKAMRLSGPCERNLIVQISGTIVAPDEPKDWDPKNPRTWLYFSNLTQVSFQGGGTIDGSGSKWWASSCKINKTNPCRGAPTALTIDSSSVVKIRDLNIQNSQQIHFTIHGSNIVRISEVRVTAPQTSPNTDGIHISGSTNVIIQDCQIGTGDDCISIVNASSNIRMKNIDCGPGHGISIGSLGNNNTTAVVSAIVLDTATLRGTTNGLRIKTWQGGSGYVRGLRFENVRMFNVSNPIIIDQFYCDSPVTCNNQTTAVKISEVLYRNISGTSKTAIAMKFACSNTVPCSNILLSNIDLTSNGTAKTFCNCAMGIDFGSVQPSASCLRAENFHCNGTQAERETQYDSPVHTEL